MAIVAMTTLKRHSYFFVFAVIVLIGYFKLATLLLTVLFSYLVLNKLSVLKYKWPTIAAFLAIVAVICTALIYFGDQAVKTLPRVANTSIPGIIQYAEQHGLELPFTDKASLKAFLFESIRDQPHYLSDFAKAASKQFVLIIIGIVTALGLYLNPATDLNSHGYPIKNNLYTLFSAELVVRFRSLYHSFRKVMGAQLVISTINTALTSVFVLAIHLPYTPLVLAITFICGLLPIIGNLISNSVIVGIAFTISPRLALWALIFLIVLHKLEYFLNSKIIGKRINNPVWLTLIGLIVGELLMGIPGMILAPVLLNYLKVEGVQIPVTESKQKD
jgi:predicted PurR-regulated permease PerM